MKRCLLLLALLPLLLGFSQPEAKAEMCWEPVYATDAPTCIYVEGEDGQLCWCGTDLYPTAHYCACDDRSGMDPEELAAWARYMDLLDRGLTMLPILARLQRN